MGLLASWEDFENGGLYSRYRRYPFFATRAEYLDKYPGTILVVGCGWGFLVDELRKRGREAWGVDLSDYAIMSASREVPDVIGYILQGDARRDLSVGPGQFDVTISEDMLTVMDNPGEMLRVHREMVKVSDTVIHLVTFDHPHKSETQDKRVRWHDRLWWGEQFGDAIIVDAVTLNVPEVPDRRPVR